MENENEYNIASRSFVRHIDEELGDEQNVKIFPPKTNTITTTVFLILNSMIGSGILNQPEVFMNSGIVGGLIVFVFASYFVWFGMILLVETGNAVQIFSFKELAKKSIGSSGEFITDLFIFLGMIGAMMGYVAIIGLTTSQLLISWGCQNEICQVIPVSSLLMFCIELPLCLARFYGEYGFISVISMVSISSILGLVLIGGPFLNQSTDRIILANAEGTLSRMGSVVFALSASAATFPAYTSLVDNSVDKWKIVMTTSVLVGAFMCITMGIGGYLIFGNQTESNIIFNFPGVVAQPFKVLLIVHLLLYIPPDFVLSRAAFTRLIGVKHQLGFCSHICITFLLLAIPTALVMYLFSVSTNQQEVFGFILDLTGGISASILSFILPATMYLLLTPYVKASYYWQAILMLLFGIFVLITVPTLIFLSYK